MAAGEQRWLLQGMRLHQGTCAYIEACAEGYRFDFDTFRAPCDACYALVSIFPKHCLWCLQQPTCPLGEQCRNGPRKWFRFPPEKDEFVWETDADQFRPVIDILHHADMFSPEGVWLDSIQNSVYDLPAGLQLITRIFHVRRAITLVQSYGVPARSLVAPSTHSFLFTEFVMQSTFVTYYTITFCGCVLWTTEPAKHRDWNCHPILCHIFHTIREDSMVFSSSLHGVGLRFHDAVWSSLKSHSSISAPLPHWIRQLSTIPVKKVKREKKKGSPQRIIRLHTTLSSTSASFTPTTCMSSLTTSMNLLLGLPLFLLPGGSIFSILLPI
ncbi:hypothetical protein HF521_016955 [Silurus meridionalis]|uniref:Uncharacterized protein n=1 Tax=Silurus meridionalis TaxID=175797 RepID=A0A8T0BLE0_SILME|nr:hypothetical protein HF521_016955 [Silurus meridionalis]